MPLPATELFTGSAGPLSGQWTQQRTTQTIDRDGSGSGRGSDTLVSHHAFWNDDVFNDDQYSQVQIVSGLIAGTYNIGVTVRAKDTGDANFDCYEAWTYGTSGAGGTEFAKWIDGTQTSLGGITVTVGDGDIIKLKIEGDELEFSKNGTPIAQTNDASLTSGSAGVRAYQDGALMDNWEGGNLESAPPEPIMRNSRAQFPPNLRFG